MSDNSTQDFLNNIPAPASTKNEAANDAVRTFRQGLQNVANSTKTSEDALTDVVHSVYSESTGHQPTAAPRGKQGSYSMNDGHSWGK